MPATAVPEPGGSPVPSGGMLMSHPAMSAGVTIRPRSGVSRCAAGAQPASSTMETTASALGEDMLHLAVRRDAPGHDAVVVEDDVAAVVGEDLVASRLHRAGIVRRARLQDRRLSVPSPRVPKPRERTRKHRSDELGVRPRLSAVGRDLDLANRASARPRDAGDLGEPGTT